MKQHTVTVAQLRELLALDTVTGVLTWKERQCGKVPAQWNTKYAGTVAGALRPDGRLIVSVLSEANIRAHHITWAMWHGEWPAVAIDHIDGNPSNNAIANLRAATNSQNCANQFREHKSKSGYKGVSWSAGRNKWQAHIKHMGKSIALGRFNTAEEAHAAYCKAAKEIFGEFALTGPRKPKAIQPPAVTL